MIKLTLTIRPKCGHTGYTAGCPACEHAKEIILKKTEQAAEIQRNVTETIVLVVNEKPTDWDIQPSDLGMVVE